jgi:hypothetical protein
MPKYTKRKIVINNADEYSHLLERRGIDAIEQYGSFFFANDILEKEYTVVAHTWKKGDRLFKLSYLYYDTIKYWWIIALWNSKPTDAHYEYGDEVLIPFPPEDIFREIAND